jgi:sarcosine oxidase
METLTTDVVVVGLGAFGSAALWRLAARGVDVVGIERQGIGHPFGSSHGATRLFRIACQEHPGLAPIAMASLSLWADLGAETGETLVRQTGCLSTGAPGSRPVAGTRAAAAAAGTPVVEMGHDELVARQPTYGALGADDVAVWDPGAGICYPERNVRAQTAAAQRLGATVYPHTRVTSIEVDDDGVTVTTPTVALRAQQVVVAAGAWLGTLVPGLPLTPRRMPLYWFEPEDAASAEYTLDRFPAFIRRLPSGRTLWGHGSDEDYGIKIGMEDVGDNFADTDPDDVDRYVHSDRDTLELSALVAEAFPGIRPRPSKVIPCMITNSPDGQFVVGRPNASPRLVVAGGDSGHGFKHAAGVGELLAQIVVGEEPFCDTAFLEPDRFLVGAGAAGSASAAAADASEVAA